MRCTHFKIITVGACDNGSPLLQTGVYQSAAPSSQMRKHSLLSHYCGPGSGALEARGHFGDRRAEGVLSGGTYLRLISSQPRLGHFNQLLGSVRKWCSQVSVKDKNFREERR